jgi:GT2 family glycosyltransferase
MSPVTATAVVVAYGSEPWLERCVAAILASATAHVDVVIVDNGDTSGGVDRLSATSGVTVIRPGRNTGFAEGCNLGADRATGEVVVLVNPDVIVEPTAIARLASVALEPGVGIATASLRLADQLDHMNSAGNPVHFLGLAWAGAHGDPAERHATRTRVASASGACCALRRAVWNELGGFEPAYFAYHEDVELSLRCWQRGLEVSYVPDAVAAHHYEFSRNALKSYLLERNRWFTLLTLYSASTLLLLGPALIVLELLILVVATAQGWLPAKLSGYRWLITHRALVRARRARVQGERVRTDRELAPLLAARLEPTNVAAVPGIGIVNAALSSYWRVVRRALR